MNKRRTIITVLVVALLCVVISPAKCVQRAHAQEMDEGDRVFMDFLLSDVDSNSQISYSHTPLYDEALQPSGRQYLFTVNGVSGYALLAEIPFGAGVLYEVEELFYSASSPFAQCQGLPIYVTHRLYLQFNNGVFSDIATGIIVSDEFVAQQAQNGFGYCGVSTFSPLTTTVSYSTKATTATYSITGNLPDYCAMEGGTNCANAAGAVLIGYYDRFCENLIPNYSTYISMGSVFRYKSAGVEIDALIQDLYVAMETDVHHLGTTYAQFQAGMRSYVQSKGYTYSTTNMFTNGSLDFNKYKNAVESNLPVAFFLSGFAILGTIETGSGIDTINSTKSNGTHVSIGCGYKIDTYYDADGDVLTTRTYYKVASVLGTYGIGYLNMNDYGNIDRAIAVEIE